MTHYYKGKGLATDQQTDNLLLPQIDTEGLTDGAGYVASRELADAVNVALTLGMPLLLTGAPGCGKTRLAESLSWELTEGRLFEFPVKSNTESSNLFYSFDTLGRYHAGVEEQPKNFITYTALGLGMLYAMGKDGVDSTIVPQELIDDLPEKGVRSVVLIDEIDKAGRDVPNDLLDEIDRLRFVIPELQRSSIALDDEKKKHLRPIVIITSNAERTLPAPFLRRCVYYHIPFPPFDAEISATEDRVTVESIIQSRVGERFRNGEKFLNDALALFKYLREEPRHFENKTSIAQLLNWLFALSETFSERKGDSLHYPSEGLAGLGEDRKKHLIVISKCTLFTTDTDQSVGAQKVENWLAK